MVTLMFRVGKNRIKHIPFNLSLNNYSNMGNNLFENKVVSQTHIVELQLFNALHCRTNFKN